MEGGGGRVSGRKEEEEGKGEREGEITGEGEET